MAQIKEAEALQKIVDEINRIGDYKAQITGTDFKKALVFSKETHQVAWSIFYILWGEYSVERNSKNRVQTVLVTADLKEVCDFIHE